MPYLGSTPTSQNFIAGTDTFTGTGSQTDWTLSRSVNSVNDIQVVIANVVQNPASYSVNGNLLTISPSVGNGVALYVRYLTTTLQSSKPSQGAVGTPEVADGAITPAKLSTGAPTWTTTGNLTATGNVTAYSDARLKTDVATITAALALVEKMRGVSFVKDGRNSVGVIAQEMQQVLPEVVQEGEYLSVAYGNIVGVLIEAVKELSERVKELEKK